MDLKHYSLKNSNGLEVVVSNLGGRIKHVLVPNQTGHKENIVLHLDGGLKGRDASSNDRDYFSSVYWEFDPLGHHSVSLSHFSPSGQNAHSGNLKVTIIYALTDENELRIDYKAMCDAETPVNLGLEIFFTLGEDPKLIIETDAKVEGNLNQILPLKGTVGVLRKVAELADEKSGQWMKVFTTEGSLVVRSVLHNGSSGTSLLPTTFPTAILKPGEIYRQTTAYVFGISK